MARIAESAKSSLNRRAFEATMNSSEQLLSTRSTIKGDGGHWEKANSGGGGHISSGSASGNTGGSQGSSRGNNGASSSGGSSGGGSCNTPPGRCWRYRQRGHRKEECTTKGSDFMPRCARCSGFGHEESACLSDATILVMELPDDASEEEKVFAANATGKCSLRIGEEVGDGELDKKVAQYITDSGATYHLTLDANGLTNYRECSRPLDLAKRRKISIADYGDLTVAFRSNESCVHVKLHDVAHAPLLSYNLVSLTSLAQEGHPSAVEESGVTLTLKEGGTMQFSLIGKLCHQYGYRPEATSRMVDTACAVVAPGQAKAPTTPTDITLFHCTYGHTHDALLKQTVKQQRVSLSEELHECRGCSMEKGLRKTIARSTDTRADKKLERVFVDLSRKMVVPSIGGK